MNIIMIAWIAVFVGKLAGLLNLSWLIVIFFPVVAILGVFVFFALATAFVFLIGAVLVSLKYIVEEARYKK